jgi:Phage integrase family
MWHPHELRHSAASLMLAKGVPLQVDSEALGHSSIRMTADVYGHVLQPLRRGCRSRHEQSALGLIDFLRCQWDFGVLGVFLGRSTRDFRSGIVSELNPRGRAERVAEGAVADVG